MGLGRWLARASSRGGLRAGCEEILVIRDGAANFRVLLEPELKLCDANRQIFHTLDGLQVLRLHLPPHLLKLDGLAVIDVADDLALSVDAPQVLRSAEASVSLGAHAVA